ncbi:sulfatase family protein [Variovorax sp. PBL-E5]|uniref:sulfatase family protein n=1 Tax=Variovorax sp. PBL-E5 TaxID=434014 RepID=UPI001315C836|nr:sulfatase-like hydrolase/transferase [Variovorax sp. PBL-E5]VTU27580.1 Arylsulfatase [Variovorax sp. PBL-E5]
MNEKPNIILIMTDQQRHDTIHALGAPWMKTPVLDRLAREGAAFTNCYVTSPVCVGSRASLFTGMYPHATGVFTNFHPWEPTWVRCLADAGYHCVNIGKMHINPYDAKGGFHQRFFMENKDRPLFLHEHPRALYDEWDKALHARKLQKPSRYTRFSEDPQAYRNALGAFPWQLDEDMHSDMFVGDNAVWWLRERQSAAPLFLQIGFPGPHPPYDPLPRYLEQYENVDIPVPETSDEELAAQPASHGQLRSNMIRNNYDSVSWKDRPSKDELLRVRRHYAANVTMIDDKVGEIMQVLDERGYLENAIVIFTSDHGDALGDHGHIQKWTMYEGSVKVPLIIWSKSMVGQRMNDSLVQLMDIAPTVLEAAGITPPTSFEAKSLWPILKGEAPAIRTEAYSELARDHIQTGAEYMVMRRDERWKVVFYLGENYGELYDLHTDPGELRNLWNASEHEELRERLVKDLLVWSLRGSIASRQQSTPQPQQPMLIS